MDGTTTNGTLGYTAQLISNNSLAAKRGETQTAFTVDSQFDRNSITTNKIRNFSFSSGTGGTIVLGGSNNGNGLLQVKNSVGGTIVKLDNTGISVTNGSISVISALGSTIIDSTGLNSLQNFETVAITGSGGTITSTSYVQAFGITGTTSSFTRTANVLFFFTGQLGLNASNGTGIFNGQAVVTIYIDGSEAGAIAALSISAQRNILLGGSVTIDESTLTQSRSFQYLAALGTGTHIFELRAKILNTVGNAALTNLNGALRLDYLVLGK